MSSTALATTDTRISYARRLGVNASRRARLTPLASALALVLVAGGLAASDVQAQSRPFSSGWFAAKGAAQTQAARTGRLPNGMLAGINPAARQQQAARKQLNRSVQNLGSAAAAIAAQQAAQAAARAAAQNDPSVPDGLGKGGLEAAVGELAKWQGANAPVHTQSGGQHNVAIKQTESKAILNWETFNVGRNTTVNFQQKSTDAVLNRVVGADVAPSQIQGAIKGDGTVMVVNQNGVVFSGSSQVNVRNLVVAAANISDTDFNNGLYNGANPTFTNAEGKIIVEQGAMINTTKPANSTTGGGYVLLAGKEVHNAGTITTPSGQTLLAAGDSFVIKRGQGTAENQTSTTRGNEVTASGEGSVLNTGLIQATTGDITLTATNLRQDGVAVATTSTSLRGTVHLNAVGADSTITLGKDSTTAILLEDTDATALDNQRDGLQGPTIDNSPDTQNFVAADPTRRELSLIDIKSGGTVDFEGESLTLATGGQIMVDAPRTLVRDGAELDVSGAVGVKVSMESNNLKINIQGNEMRDAPVNRDSDPENNRSLLSSTDVWVDRRSLVFVPADTNGYDTDRWYTAGGLLEVSGYLATQGHTVGEWMAQGGIVQFKGNDVITQAGSRINVSGGTLDVQDGFINQSWLRGADGRLYELSRAPGDLLYKGLYQGFQTNHPRWGETATRTFYNPLIAPRQRFETGYTVGRDAGKLVISTSNAVLEGQIVGETFQGDRQTQAAQAGIDGYYQSQSAVARRGQLIVGNYMPYYVKDSGTLQYALGANDDTLKNVILGNTAEQIAAGLNLDTVLPEEREGTLYLNTDQLNDANLGGIQIAAGNTIAVENDLNVAHGGAITLYGPQVNVNADLTAHSGSIHLGNVLNQVGDNGYFDAVLSAPVAGVTVAGGATINASGLWSNLLLDPTNRANLAYQHGGSVSVRSSGNVTLETGSLINVSSGAALRANGTPQGGRGGNVTLAASSGRAGGELTLDGGIHGHGVNGGGTLQIETGSTVVISGQPLLENEGFLEAGQAAPINLRLDEPYTVAAGSPAPMDTAMFAAGSALPAGTVLAKRVAVQSLMMLASDFFNKGFSDYQVIGQQGVTVAEGAQVNVSMPVLRMNAQARSAATGSDPSAALEIWTPPLHLENPIDGVLTQRRGASLSLRAGSASSTQADIAVNLLHIARDAVINVDPGQSIALQGIGQITVDGMLNAWSGRIELRQGNVAGDLGDGAQTYVADDGRSIWIGETATLDVAARAVTAGDARGNRYGQVRSGGSIVIGGTIDHAARNATLPVPFVVIREGALLDASGTSALLDIPGQGATTVASHGGSISMASLAGLYLDGELRAKAGGVGAAGGSLALASGVRGASSITSDRLRQAHEMVLTQDKGASLLPTGITAGEAADQLVYGHTQVSADQVEAGGFDTLSLFSKGMIAFDGDVNLTLGQSLNLYAGALGLTQAAGANTRVNLSAPYVRLAGSVAPSRPDVPGSFLLGMHHGAGTQPLSQQPEAGSLRLEAGRVLDVEAGSGLGDGGSLTLTRLDGSSELIDRRGFADMLLVSQGDMRIGQGTFYATGDLTLAAAQVYPTTGVSATVHAGWRASAGYDPDRRLVIARTTDNIPTMPYSVFGSLTLGAVTIDQGGIIRAPLGALNIGYSRTPQQTQTVNLLPGSLTSVSAGGLLMPYGGTVDGQVWQYDGEDITLYAVGGTQGDSFNANRTLQVGVSLLGESVDIRQGATVDLSGGGELLGAAFISGRGGSTDARFHPLVQIGSNGLSLPGLNTNPIYAIVPGVQQIAAPAVGESGAVDPMLGQQVTIGSGVPGLAAGTYTLLPSTYALLPGAYRVELNGSAGLGALLSPQAMRNGSWSASGVLSIAGTGIRDNLANQLILTPADVLRRYSQYNEMRYADFVRADAARLGIPRGMLEADAKTLSLSLRRSDTSDVGFSFDGTVLGEAAEGGFGSTLSLSEASNGKIELLADDGHATEGYLSVYASDLSAMDVNRLVIGTRPLTVYGQGGNVVDFGTTALTAANTIVLRSGATLSAPEVMLVSRQSHTNPSGIEIEQGASIITLGQGKAAYDSDDGFIYQAGDKSVVAVSNGRLQWLAPEADTYVGPGSILVGTCMVGGCEGQTQLYSEGSITFATDNTFELDDAVRYGTRHLTLAVGAFNIGSAQALAAADARGALTAGLSLDQSTLQRLLQGDTSTGAPALETLELAASRSMNFFESVTLSTLNAQGESLLDNLLLTAPAIYGYGAADEVALIQTGNLIWNGSDGRPGAVAAGGAGTGSGSLTIEAERIEFGYAPFSQPSGVDDLGRLALGFANVNLSASERITANNRGSLAVYQSQGAYVSGEGVSYSGGNLNIITPLLTGAAGSVNHMTAGGAVTVTAPEGSTAAMVNTKALGAELAITGQSLLLDTAVVLPSGKLALTAEDDLTLADGAHIDMAGRDIEFFEDEEATQFSWGGNVTLQSHSGNIHQGAGSIIDLSAEYNQAGRLTAIALDEGAGAVNLQGQIQGNASGYYEAGGTWVPYAAGGVDIRAQRLGSGNLSEQFAALNHRLNEGDVLGMRHFQVKQGNLTVGDELRAGDVSVSVDNGHLTVAGTINASGERVGSIRLAGKHGLTLASNAVLDAHGTILRLDSYGKIIDSPNRAIVELSSGDGRLVLANGASIDLRHGTDDARVQADPTLHDNRDRGTLELNAPRLGGATAGDVDIDAGGTVTIQGARSIAVNAVQRYDDAADGADDAASGKPYQVIDQAYLDAKHADSADFIDTALKNTNLLNNKLASLNNDTYRNAFHLRPGVEIVSKTPDGDMIVSGDLDLSDHRYESLNQHTQKTSVYGSGEVGSLVIRAGGNLDIYGSINDGFAPPPETPDDDGWVLTPGYIAYGGDVITPAPGVTLSAGTEFAAGKTLNYDLPIGATQFAAGTQLPIDTVLDASLTLHADTVLQAPIYDAAGGLLYAAGTIVKEAVTLEPGTRLGAGTVLPGSARLQAMRWPKGAVLPGVLTLAGDLALPRGALIPSETLVMLPEDAISMPLRPANGDRQGKNWAVAAMLPEGSQSWSMRIVAGADTQAADSRLTRKEAAGSLILADAHYSLFRETAGGGAWYWAEGNWYGDTGTPVEDWALDPGYNICEQEPGQCVQVTWLWAEGNWYGTAGTPVEDWALDPGYNICEQEPGQCLNIGGSGEVVGLYPAAQNFSVLRTGIGDLDMISGGDIHMQSLYGVYTAGVSTASEAESQAATFNQPRAMAGDGSYLGTSIGADENVNAGYEALVDGGTNSIYAAWYPGQGGNLLLRTGGDLTGDILATNSPLGLERELRGQSSSTNLGNWLWRQGTGDTEGIDSIPTSWWINFGTYVPGGASTNAYHSVSGVQSVPELVGFTGFGTLGGGNLNVDVAGNAGMLSRRGGTSTVAPRSQGLVVAVGSTGRVNADGELLLTGGGDMTVRVGGGLNPGLRARVDNDNNKTQSMNLTGVLANLRGVLQVQGGALGGIDLSYGSLPNRNDLKETRAYDPFRSTKGVASGGLVLMLGDAVASLNVRGDLVVSGTGDPGRVPTPNSSVFVWNGNEHTSGGRSWFSLWTDNTAIHLLSAGGNLTPSTQLIDTQSRGGVWQAVGGHNYSTTDGRFIYPSQLSAVAAQGSIYMGSSAAGRPDWVSGHYSLLAAPSVNGHLQLLAADSIYAGGYAVNQSGAGLATIPTPFNPGFAGTNAGGWILVSNTSRDGFEAVNSFFTFGPNTTVGAEWGSVAPARFYAGQDIVGLRSGEILQFNGGARAGQTWYESAGPVWMMAGRDIVNSGTAPGESTGIPSVINSGFNASTGNLFVHNDPNDVSIVSAGQDILYSSFNVAGPGTLEITAGRNILMEDRASVTSLGPVVLGDSRPGASIVMQAGLGASGANYADYASFLTQYLSTDSLADPDIPLADQDGKVVKTYEAELIEWLADRYGFVPSSDEVAADEALTYFGGLGTEQQRIFAREVYFTELREGGREYNDPDSPRFGSHLRGRNVIASLFPEHNAAGEAIVYQGDLLMYGGSGIHTNMGGDIQLLTPGGAQTFGVEGTEPPSTAGVITRGQGDIQMYSLGSILLGQSRVMTTFGGDILGWSAKGDINAGRGASTTIVYTPPSRIYDQWGNVTISPVVPSSGAGIATLNPIAEVAPGSVDLIAPLGTIDAGEAGIRVSGDVNIAALHVVNADNIQVQGESTGIPVMAAVNVGALTSASAAASSAATAAQDTVSRARAEARQNQPSIFSVQILGFGSESASSGSGGSSAASANGASITAQQVSYQPNHMVQVLGRGQSPEGQGAGLTADERRSMGL
ncbi:filamentous hemagglutinin-like protein [Pusillimonas sp. T7-7]|uniref:filamentous hemagglutinin family protein n=1 Tax=Pusillimonas sp. (strain T7-7) TaxID=1007105 RepID=UPI0002086B40|nr:filamentous hemagglutinin family protein [Pusillimonas sp. T7-7]AEC18812.1 filamentous hemagglutinin-like protein [Pusillimonas sp. T7-7]